MAKYTNMDKVMLTSYGSYFPVFYYKNWQLPLNERTGLLREGEGQGKLSQEIERAVGNWRGIAKEYKDGK